MKVFEPIPPERDIIVANLVIVEVKAVEKMIAVFDARL